MYCFLVSFGNDDDHNAGYLRVYHQAVPRYAGSTPHSMGRSSMHKKRSGVLAAALLVTMTSGLIAQNKAVQSKKETSTMPKVGDMAPDFTLKHFDGNDLKDVKLSDYRGKKNVVLAFYIFAFTGG